MSIATATPPGWDASPLQVTPQHFVVGTHLYSRVERGIVRIKYLAQEHCTRKTLALKSKSLTIRPPDTHNSTDKATEIMFNNS